MKRLIALMAFMLTLFSITACSSETKTTTANPKSNKVLFIGGEVGDPFLIQRLKKMGMEVTAKTGKEVTAEDVKNVGLIYISYTAKPSDLGTKLVSTTAPIITSTRRWQPFME
ncbi:hypothetical protein [Bacillus sp. 3255]|uniref:hypothetical protein n=1 Tax=Bacillus sp. 3255 TaxID=2817904 RepID=UPI0028559DF9|nr:hypothetical protein [Bacillus sp. 3255]MDR6879529.1 enoyl-CoA hydratase/carnithine racemase [Bacillus sp. 3255]